MIVNGTLRNWNNPNVPNTYVVTYSKPAMNALDQFLARGGDNGTLWIALMNMEHRCFLAGTHKVTLPLVKRSGLGGGGA